MTQHKREAVHRFAEGSGCLTNWFRIFDGSRRTCLSVAHAPRTMHGMEWPTIIIQISNMHSSPQSESQSQRNQQAVQNYLLGFCFSYTLPLNFRCREHQSKLPLKSFTRTTQELTALNESKPPLPVNTPLGRLGTARSRITQEAQEDVLSAYSSRTGCITS